MVLDNFIWDFDGTLFDTYSVMLKALIQTLADFQLHFDSKELYRLIKRESVGFAANYFGKVYGIDPKLISQRYHEIESKLQTHPKPFIETADVLKTILQKGKHNFLYTHRDNRVFEYLKNYQLDTAFTGTITANNDFPRKPDPAAILYLVEHYQLDKTKTVMIGDRSLDVKAGKSAGVRTIYFDVDRFHDSAKADFVVTNLKQITALLSI